MSPGVKIPARTPYVGYVCYSFSPLHREVFLRVLRFFPLLKNQHFEILIRSGRTRTRFNKLLRTPKCSVGKKITITITKKYFALQYLSFYYVWRQHRTQFWVSSDVTSPVNLPGLLASVPSLPAYSDSANRTIARWRHFTTATRILEFVVFRGKLRLLFFYHQRNWQI